MPLTALRSKATVAVVIACLIILVALALLTPVPQVVARLPGFRPTREEHLRDCPRLPGSIYFEYRTSSNRQQPVLLIVYVSPPDAELPSDLGAQVLLRRGGQINLRVPIEQACRLANLPEVVEVVAESSPTFP
jgi:hypothetical protein